MSVEVSSPVLSKVFYNFTYKRTGEVLQDSNSYSEDSDDVDNEHPATQAKRSSKSI